MNDTNDAQVNELMLLTALESLVTATQVDGNKVCNMDDLADVKFVDHLSVEGLDNIVVSIKKIKAWIANFVIKISLYIRKTLAKMKSTNLDPKTTYALNARFHRIKDFKDLSEEARDFLESNTGYYIAASLGFVNGLPNLFALDDYGLSLETVNDTLKSIGVSKVDFELEKKDVVTGIAITDVKKDSITFAYVTSTKKFGTKTMLCGKAKHKDKMADHMDRFFILNESQMDSAYDHLENKSKQIAKEFSNEADENAKQSEVNKDRAIIGFRLSVIVKQVALIGKLNDYVISIAEHIGD